MKRINLVILLVLTFLTVMAKDLELADITTGKFSGESLGAVQPLSDGETYARLSSDGQRIVLYSFKTGKENGTLFDASAAHGADLQRIDGYIVSPDGQRLLIQTETQKVYRRSFTATYYIYDSTSKHLERLSADGREQTPLFSPDGKSVAFVRDNNIYLLAGGQVMQITYDGCKNEIINGIPDWVNEEEFSINRAMVFTSDGKHLVWVRYDETAVKEFGMPLFKGLKPERTEFALYPGTYSYKYPVAGEQNSMVSVWSYNLASKETRQLQVPIDADGYVPRLVMTSDAPHVAVYTLNRHQDCLRIYKVNAQTMVAAKIIEDKGDRYIREESLGGIQFTDRHILLPSDRDGYLHLYLYDMDGKLLRQIEAGDYEVSDVYGYDEQTGDTYYASHEGGAVEQRIWVAHANGKRQCLTPKAGWNTALFSKSRRYFIHTWSDLNTPPVCVLRTSKGKLLETLSDNSELVSQLKDYTLGSRELFTFTTSEGVVLNGWMVKPADFDASRRYPVVMYQYGGPGSQQVRNAWGIGMSGQGAILEQYLCQQGYVCVCVDNRGTGGRGAAFEKCTYQQLGKLEAADQVETALWLGQQSYVDHERIAIWGWSYGGFNALMSMSEGRGVFRAGIAIAPPTSWRYYDSVYTERYMRTPQENPAGYDDCPIARAEQLHGALLLCHGMADDNVHFRNTAEYTEALVQADKDFRQLVYTNRNHSIYGGNTRHHLFRQCVKFLDEELRK